MTDFVYTIGMCVWDPVFGVDGPHPYGKRRDDMCCSPLTALA